MKHSVRSNGSRHRSWPAEIAIKFAHGAKAAQNTVEFIPGLEFHLSFFDVTQRSFSSFLPSQTQPNTPPPPPPSKSFPDRAHISHASSELSLQTKSRSDHQLIYSLSTNLAHTFSPCANRLSSIPPRDTFFGPPPPLPTLHQPPLPPLRPIRVSASSRFSFEVGGTSVKGGTNNRLALPIQSLRAPLSLSWERYHTHRHKDPNTNNGVTLKRCSVGAADDPPCSQMSSDPSHKEGQYPPSHSHSHWDSQPPRGAYPLPQQALNYRVSRCRPPAVISPQPHHLTPTSTWPPPRLQPPPSSIPFAPSITFLRPPPPRPPIVSFCQRAAHTTARPRLPLRRNHIHLCRSPRRRQTWSRYRRRKFNPIRTSTVIRPTTCIQDTQQIPTEEGRNNIWTTINQPHGSAPPSPVVIVEDGKSVTFPRSSKTPAPPRPLAFLAGPSLIPD
jgi:hypothetical protein